MSLQNPVGLSQYVVFSFTKNDNRAEKYAVNVSQIKEIQEYAQITAVPNSHPSMRGILNVRGQIIPIIDLRKILSLPDVLPDKTHILISDVDKNMIGFLVDKVEQVIKISEQDIDFTKPEFLKHIDYISSIAKINDELISILDLKKIINSLESVNLGGFDK